MVGGGGGGERGGDGGGGDGGRGEGGGGDGGGDSGGGEEYCGIRMPCDALLKDWSHVCTETSDGQFKDKLGETEFTVDGVVNLYKRTYRSDLCRFSHWTISHRIKIVISNIA